MLRYDLCVGELPEDGTPIIIKFNGILWVVWRQWLWWNSDRQCLMQSDSDPVENGYEGFECVPARFIDKEPQDTEPELTHHIPKTVSYR